MPHQFHDGAFEIENFSVTSEEDARKYVRYPDAMCFGCPIFKSKKYSALCSYLERLILLQDAGIVFRYEDLPIDIIILLGIYKRKKGYLSR